MIKFNFTTVYDTMNYLGWTWRGEEFSPSQDEMIYMVERELFEYALKSFKNETITVSSGGFTVRIFENGRVQIQFVVESSQSEE